MNLLKLIFKNILSRPLNSLMSLILLVLGITIISMLLLIGNHYDEKFKKDIRGVDLVLGAKGSPLQLILSSIYHMDAPTGNINLAEANKVGKHPMVKLAIPLSYGDSYKGYRIVGSTHDYPKNYEMELESGRLWEKSFEVTLGANVAALLGVELGDTLISSHGFDSNGESHSDGGYIVVGIFKRSGSVLDKLLLTSLESVWDVHAHHGAEGDHAEDKHDEDEHDHAEGDEHDHDHDDDHGHEDDHEDENREITAMLIKFSSQYGMFQIPRKVNEETNMQSALPAIEINRLFGLLGIGLDGLRLLAMVIIFISAISIFISLYNSIKEKKYELALLRTLGASRFKLLGITLLEAVFLVAVGFVLSALLSRIGFAEMLNYVEGARLYAAADVAILASEITLGLAMLGVAILAALLPSLQAFKLNISKTLSES